MSKFRKKPVVIDAMQAVPSVTVDDLKAFAGMDEPPFFYQNGHIHIRTLEGTMRAEWGDWIIKGVKGEFYPCKPDIFEATYERLADDGEPLGKIVRGFHGDDKLLNTPRDGSHDVGALRPY